MPQLFRCIAIVMACHCIAYAAEPPAKSKRKFPAELKVTSSKMLDDGQREVELQIVLEKDVEIYSEWDHKKGDFSELPIAKFSVFASDGTLLPVRVIYPKPNVTENIEGVGAVHSYAESLKIKVQFAPPEKGDDLKVRCKLAGWNRRRSCCLGFGQIETELLAKPSR